MLFNLAFDRSGCVAGVASYVIHLCCKRIAPASDHMTAHSCYCAAGGPSSEDVPVLASGGIRSWAPFSSGSLSCCRPCSDRGPRAWRLEQPTPSRLWQTCNRFGSLPSGRNRGPGPVCSFFSAILVGARLGRAQVSVLATALRLRCSLSCSCYSFLFLL